MTRKEKLIYLAGFTDGEGHFHTPNTVNGRGEHKIYPRIVIVNTNKEVVDWIKSNFGGSIHEYERSKENSKHRNVFRWSLTGKAVTKLALELQPYLIVKKEQVLRVIN